MNRLVSELVCQRNVQEAFDRFILERASEAISFWFGFNSVQGGVSKTWFIMRPLQEAALFITLRLSVPSVTEHGKFAACLQFSPQHA